MKDHEGFEGFSKRYLVFLEKLYLERWKYFFNMVLSTQKQLEGVREVLYDSN